MIKYIIFLIAVLTMALIAFNIFTNVINVKVNAYNDVLTDIPIIVVSHNDTILFKISDTLKSFDFVEKTAYTMADTIRKNLIKRYKLEAADKYLNNSDLPNILKIFVKKGKFESDIKIKIADILSKYKENISIKYNDDLWQETRSKIDFLKDFYRKISIVYWLTVVILIIILKVIFENLNAYYWEKYFKSGGLFKGWLLSRVYQSFFIALFSVGLSYLFFIPLKVFSPYFIPANYMILIYEFIGILLVNLISIIFLIRKYA